MVLAAKCPTLLENSYFTELNSNRKSEPSRGKVAKAVYDVGQ